MSRLLNRLISAFSQCEGAGHSEDGIAAWAHSEVANATCSVLTPDDDGQRVAIHCRMLRHPLWRQTSENREYLLGRIAAAWPELSPDQMHRVLAHLDVVVRAAIAAPGRTTAQRPARKNFVNSWRDAPQEIEVRR